MKTALPLALVSLGLAGIFLSLVEWYRGRFMTTKDQHDDAHRREHGASHSSHHQEEQAVRYPVQPYCSDPDDEFGVLVLDELRLITRVLAQLAHYARALLCIPLSLQISQLQGVTSMPITGITAGGQPGVFAESPLPAGSVFPAGTTFTWATDDPAASIGLTPSSDGIQVTAAVPATFTAPSFGLACTAQMPGGVAGITASVAVPVSQPAPAVPSAMEINQVS